jgi:hypothetical protein
MLFEVVQDFGMIPEVEELTGGPVIGEIHWMSLSGALIACRCLVRRIPCCPRRRGDRCQLVDWNQIRKLRNKMGDRR